MGMKLLQETPLFGSDIEPKNPQEYGQNDQNSEANTENNESGQNASEIGVTSPENQENLEPVQGDQSSEVGYNEEASESQDITEANTEIQQDLQANNGDLEITEQNLENTIVNTEVTAENAHDMVKELEELNLLLQKAQGSNPEIK